MERRSVTLPISASDGISHQLNLPAVPPPALGAYRRTVARVEIGEYRCKVSDLTHRQQLELQLKAELDQAEQRLRNATPEEKDEARKRFSEALHNFTMLIFEDKAPLFVVPPKSAP